ncbi:hypothetical protein [Nostoc sp. ChiQUE01b]|uniref:hypothetical protein n=1 Tax=Nostoc sp. ChiQUE01b TaxID=3075376 RepID=UPI002AD2DE1C|nr:hypothetical protein [Nostoc sp. ChiQUE01b]MDZ8260629.1 hypothetical protein [Nostoc sp. ChiQUE01b]
MSIVSAQTHDRLQTCSDGLSPNSALGQRFLHYFQHPWGFIHAPTPQTGERPAWQTETRYPLQPRNLWSLYQNPDILLGLRFGTETNYLLQDIDIGSQYHSANSLENFKAVLTVLEEIGLVRPILVQSSVSGGIHVYYFFREKLNSFSLACAVTFALRSAGMKLQGGQLELFPNAKPYGKGKPTNFNAHRLPLQDGSFLLDSTYQPCSASLEDFLDAADWSAEGQDYVALHASVAEAKNQVQRLFTRGQTSNLPRCWKQHLEERFRQGWTDFHQTNALLKDIACYGIVFRHLLGEPLVDYVVATAEAATGYHQFCRHQHEIRQRATEWARSCENFYSPYASIPNRLGTYQDLLGDRAQAANNVVVFSPNHQRHAETLARVCSVVMALKGEGRFPASASDRARAIITASKERYGVGVSQTTLHKPDYLSLWHPLHESTGEETGVNSDAVAFSACQLPEKYPQLPDPWAGGEEEETFVGQEVQPCVSTIYTLPPYMKVVCLPPAKEIANQLKASDQQTIFHQESIDQQIQYLCNSGTTFSNNKPPLSMLETQSTPTVLEDVFTADSSVDYKAANPSSVSGDTTAPFPLVEQTSNISAFSTTSGVDMLSEQQPAAGESADDACSFTPEQYRQATKLRLDALAQAKKRVRMHCMTFGVHFAPVRRQELEQLGLRILLIEADSPLLSEEAHSWFTSNRDRLARDGLIAIATAIFSSQEKADGGLQLLKYELGKLSAI